MLRLDQWPNIDTPTIHIHRVYAALALTRLVVTAARTNDWEDRYEYEVGGVQYDHPALPTQDLFHTIELQPLGARAILLFPQRIKYDHSQLDPQPPKDWKEYKVTIRTQEENQRIVRDFEIMDLNQFMIQIPQRSHAFWRCWFTLLENHMDLLNTVMTLHQAAAFDALRLLEQRTKILLERATRDRPFHVHEELHIRPDAIIETVEERYRRLVDEPAQRATNLKRARFY
jgi:hypothetical protein